MHITFIPPTVTLQNWLDKPCDRTGSLNLKDIASPPLLRNIGSTDYGIPPTVFPTGTYYPDHEALEHRYNKLCGRTEDEALQHRFDQLCPSQQTLPDPKVTLNLNKVKQEKKKKKERKRNL